MKYFNEYRIYTDLSASSIEYLTNIDRVIYLSLSLSPRVTAIRFDLRFPVGVVFDEKKVITRFFESLKSQLKEKELGAKRKGKRVHPNNLKYVWVRERDTSDKDHYHCVIFLNKDAYSVLGDFEKWSGNMAARIKRAWLSALGAGKYPMDGVVHFPFNATYHFDRNSIHFFEQRADLFYRLSYFAKHATKCYGDGRRCFGCSRL